VRDALVAPRYPYRAPTHLLRGELMATLLHTVQPHRTLAEFVRHVGYLWLALGVGGLLFRTLHLFKIKGVQTGLVMRL
jgi:hypothetical protein